MDGARTGRIPTRALTVALGLFLVAALGVGALTVGAGAQGEPPERLTEKELLSRVSAAPESAPNFRATVTVEQTLVPEGLLAPKVSSAPLKGATLETPARAPPASGVAAPTDYAPSSRARTGTGSSSVTATG
jgi:hypothetical protein